MKNVLCFVVVSLASLWIGSPVAQMSQKLEEAQLAAEGKDEIHLTLTSVESEWLRLMVVVTSILLLAPPLLLLDALLQKEPRAKEASGNTHPQKALSPAPEVKALLPAAKSTNFSE